MNSVALGISIVHQREMTDVTLTPFLKGFGPDLNVKAKWDGERHQRLH